MVEQKEKEQYTPIEEGLFLASLKKLRGYYEEQMIEAGEGIEECDSLLEIRDEGMRDGLIVMYWATANGGLRVTTKLKPKMGFIK